MIIKFEWEKFIHPGLSELKKKVNDPGSLALDETGKQH